MTTLQRFGQPSSQYRTILDGIERAVADGLVMRGQVAARPVGLLMSLKGRVHPLLGSPPTRRWLAGPTPSGWSPWPSRPPGRASSRSCTPVTTPCPASSDAFGLGDPPQWTFAPERAIRRWRLLAECRPVDVAYDIIAAGGMIFVPVANFVDGDCKAREMLVHPLTVPGLGDGGAHCTMIADFDFPTYLLAIGPGTPLPRTNACRWSG